MRTSPILAAALALALGAPALFAGDPPAATASATATADASTVKLADLPKAVQETFKEKAKGAEPISIEKKVVDGKTSYVFTVPGKHDKTHTITIGEDGKLLLKADKEGHKKKEKAN